MALAPTSPLLLGDSTDAGSMVRPTSNLQQVSAEALFVQKLPYTRSGVSEYRRTRGVISGRSLSEGLLQNGQDYMWLDGDFSLRRQDAALRGPSRALSTSTFSDGKPYLMSIRDNPDLALTTGHGERGLREPLMQGPSNWLNDWTYQRSSQDPKFRHKTWNSSLQVDSCQQPVWLDSEHAKAEPALTSSKSSVQYGSCPGMKALQEEGCLDIGTLTTYCEKGELKDAVQALDQLVQQGYRVDNSLFFRVLKKCMDEKDLVTGRRVHALCVKCGYESNAFLANHIIRMYSSHGKLEEAKQVFSKVGALNTHVWSSIILAHARQGRPVEAIKLYRQMRGSPVKPDHHVFVAVLKACTVAEDLASGREVHADILESRGELNVFVGSSLVDMYAKCGDLRQAHSEFDTLPKKNVVTWNAMIGGYARLGHCQEALALYACMQKDGTTPANEVTYVNLLQACATVGALHEGKQLHADIRERGLDCANVFVGNSLVNMYAKCGSLDDACQVFETLPTKDVVTWNALITGFAHHGRGQEAIAFHARMQLDGITPANQITFACLLRACADIAALQQGEQLHAEVQRNRLDSDVLIGNCLIHMYAKCGSIKQAHRVFESLPTRDVVTWNTLLNGYAECGEGRLAIQCFSDMLRQGVEPDDTTFISLLVACSHEGLVDEGQLYFKRMVRDHAIVPTLYHFTCMIDLLGRAGHLEEAEEMLRTMPHKNAVAGWKSLLSACKSHGDVERGRRCFDSLMALEPENGAPYVLLGSMYATAGRWSDVDEVERLRRQAGATKKPAKATIEVKAHVHEFIVGEQRADVTPGLSGLSSRLKEGGHVPHTELVLKEVSQSVKEEALCGHAEKLALAYGLLNTPSGSTLLVTKNLRMCNDCHSSTKIMSRLEKREIIVRDAHRLHRFSDGSCSCKDRH